MFRFPHAHTRAHTPIQDIVVYTHTFRHKYNAIRYQLVERDVKKEPKINGKWKTVESFGRSRRRRRHVHGAMRDI